LHLFAFVPRASNGGAAATRPDGKSSFRVELRKALAGRYDRASDTEREQAIGEIIRGSSLRAAVVVLQPVSFVDIALLTPLQVRMARSIGRIHCRRDVNVGRAIFRPLLSRLALPHLTIAGVKFIPLLPVIPDVIAGSVAYALTFAIGEVADQYFRGCKKGVAFDVARRFDATYRRTFALTYRQKRAEVEAMFGKNPELAQELRALRRAQREGRLTREQLAEKAREVLDAASRS
jgi:uncharacterized protein (DUF697 family)